MLKIAIPQIPFQAKNNKQIKSKDAHVLLKATGYKQLRCRIEPFGELFLRISH